MLLLLLFGGTQSSVEYTTRSLVCVLELRLSQEMRVNATCVADHGRP